MNVWAKLAARLYVVRTYIRTVLENKLHFCSPQSCMPPHTASGSIPSGAGCPKIYDHVDGDQMLDACMTYTSFMIQCKYQTERIDDDEPHTG